MNGMVSLRLRVTVVESTLTSVLIVLKTALGGGVPSARNRSAELGIAAPSDEESRTLVSPPSRPAAKNFVPPGGKRIKASPRSDRALMGVLDRMTTTDGGSS